MIENSDERPLKEILGELLSNFHLDDGIKTMRIRNEWERIVGKMISKHTIQATIKEKTLIIKLDSASLKSELNFSKEKIIKSVNKNLGENTICEIRFL